MNPRIAPKKTANLIVANRDYRLEGAIGEITYKGPNRKVHIAFNDPLVGSSGFLTDVVPLKQQEDAITKAEAENNGKLAKNPLLTTNV